MPLLLYISSLLTGCLGAFAIKYFADRFSLMDWPCERSSHIKPTPKGGGIGILATFVFVCLVSKITVAFWIPAAFLASFSFVGDKFELSPRARLLIQFAAAWTVVQFADVGLQGSFISSLFLTLFIVGTANCYNFMDGIDGIAGMTGTVGYGLLAFYIWFSGPDLNYSRLSICIALSCLGFLPFNIPKAKVFMGDVGSILLGFVYSAVIVKTSRDLTEFLCLAGCLFPFFADEILTMARRVTNRENLLRPHRKHLYQILANEMGISHWKISAGYVFLQTVIGVSSLFAKPFGMLPLLAVLGAFSIGFIATCNTIRKKCLRPLPQELI
jgi:Fuc2NAc and GlcNAc transferase